eukprot:GHVL01018896.1.p1 GENE.GHVL01018896.1~~GHVL01018896.1.p1  ORF type:complete len:953 (-),score=179.21 GHVL01018896.1:226-2859(-)
MIAINNLAIAHTDCGTTLKLNGNKDEAIKHYRMAIETDPSYYPAFYNLAVVYTQISLIPEAIDMYQNAISLNPRYVEAYNNLGAILKKLGDLEGAVNNYTQALKCNPNFELTKCNLAVALTDLGTRTKLKGDVKLGKSLYKKALVCAPRYADAYYNLGVAYGEEGNVDKAYINYELAVTFNTSCAEAYNNLGVLAKENDNFELAIENYKKALQSNPRFAQTLNNLAVIYTLVGHMSEAYHYVTRAIQEFPEYAEAYNNLGVLYRDQGDIELAVETYERCIELDELNRNAQQNRLLALNYLSTVSMEEVFEAHRYWGFDFVSARKPHTKWPNIDRNPDKILHIGYISPDFFTHSVSYFIFSPLVYHKNIKITIYSNVVKEDLKTKTFKNLENCKNWQNIVGMKEEEVANLIISDEIDILVDITGHTANNRLDVFAWKPAPICVTWIGYPNTTGLPTIDYRITDHIADPTNTSQKYVEELIRMPNCFLCYTPPAKAPNVSVTPAIQNGFITFGSFNNIAKIGEKCINLWSKVLLSVPNSRLVLKGKPFANKLIKDAYLNMFSSTTTTFESLYMGVPVITLKNTVHSHNVGASIISSIEMSDTLVADSENKYIELAINLASDIKKLQNIRQNLREILKNSSLCDGQKFTKNLEDIYRLMFCRWVNNENPKKENILNFKYKPLAPIIVPKMSKLQIQRWNKNLPIPLQKHHDYLLANDNSYNIDDLGWVNWGSPVGAKWGREVYRDENSCYRDENSCKIQVYRDENSCKMEGGIDLKEEGKGGMSPGMLNDEWTLQSIDSVNQKQCESSYCTRASASVGEEECHTGLSTADDCHGELSMKPPSVDEGTENTMNELMVNRTESNEQVSRFRTTSNNSSLEAT